MKCTFSELREREVISTATGERIGFIDDVVIDTEKGRIISLVIYGRSRLMGLMGREENIVIPCSDIERIGTDTVLVSTGSGKLYKMNKNDDDNLFG